MFGQAFADDTMFLFIGVNKFIDNFKILSRLSENLDKTKLVQIENISNPKKMLFPDISLEWIYNFTLLENEIDNTPSRLDLNFQGIFLKCSTLINDWNARALPSEGRCAISKPLFISQYTYAASIIFLSPNQICSEQSQINNYFLWIQVHNRK